MIEIIFKVSINGHKEGERTSLPEAQARHYVEMGAAKPTPVRLDVHDTIQEMTAR